MYTKGHTSYFMILFLIFFRLHLWMHWWLLTNPFIVLCVKVFDAIHNLRDCCQIWTALMTVLLASIYNWTDRSRYFRVCLPNLHLQFLLPVWDGGGWWVLDDRRKISRCQCICMQKPAAVFTGYRSAELTGGRSWRMRENTALPPHASLLHSCTLLDTSALRCGLCSLSSFSPLPVQHSCVCVYTAACFWI